MGRPRKNQNAEQNQSPSDEDPKEEKYPEEVTFAWNRASREQVIVMTAAKVMFTDAGAITDPREPAKRIKVKNGLYTTSDRAEIAFLTGMKEFNSKGQDGFSIVKEISPEADLQSLMKRHKITKEKVAQLANQE